MKHFTEAAIVKDPPYDEKGNSTQWETILMPTSLTLHLLLDLRFSKS